MQQRYIKAISIKIVSIDMTRRIFSSSKSLLIRVQIFITKNTFYFCSIYIKNCCNNHEILVLYFQINISPLSSDMKLNRMIHRWQSIFIFKFFCLTKELRTFVVCEWWWCRRQDLHRFSPTQMMSHSVSMTNRLRFILHATHQTFQCFPSSKSVLRSHANKTLRIINHLCFCHAIVNE